MKARQGVTCPVTLPQNTQSARHSSSLQQNTYAKTESRVVNTRHLHPEHRHYSLFMLRRNLGLHKTGLELRKQAEDQNEPSVRSHHRPHTSRLEY